MNLARIALLIIALPLADCAAVKEKLKPKPLPPTTVSFHDGKRSTVVVIPHDPKPSVLIGFLKAVAGPILTLVGL